MGVLRSRTLQLVLLLLCLALSLRRVEGMEQACAVLLTPARYVAVLAQPFVWLRGRAVQAEDSATLVQGSQRVRAALAAAVLPLEPELRAGRTFVACEVVARVERAPDRWLVRAADDLAVRVGDPVVLQNHYVGRVSGQHGAEWEIELVTARDHRVGAIARHEDEIARLVVGGLRRELSRERRTGAPAVVLAAHAPSDRRVRAGEVRVQETPDASGAAGRTRANGYKLGELEVLVEGAAVLHGVRTQVDWEHGLHHVAVLVDAAPAQRGMVSAREPLDAQRWAALMSLSAGKVWSHRETLKVVDHPQRPLRTGAAVVNGLQLCGRVLAQSAGMADVALLGDPAFEVEAVAQLDGTSEVAALGRVRGLGRVNDTDVSLELSALGMQRLQDLVQRAPRAQMVLWSAGSERGVPAGLRLGLLQPARSTSDPVVGGAARTVHVRSSVVDVRRLSVWLESNEEAP